MKSDERGSWTILKKHARLCDSGASSSRDNFTTDEQLNQQRRVNNKKRAAPPPPPIAKEPSFPPRYNMAVPQQPSHWMLPADGAEPPAVARRCSPRLTQLANMGHNDAAAIGTATGFPADTVAPGMLWGAPRREVATRRRRSWK